MQRQRIAGAVLTIAAVLATSTACGSDDKSSKEGDSKPLVVKITIKGDTLDPNGKRIDVATGQPIDLEVTADAPGEIHVHSDPEHELSYPAGTTRLDEFVIDRPGVVAVESHTLDKTIVQLEVK